METEPYLAQLLRGVNSEETSIVLRLLGLRWDEYEALKKKDIFGCEVVCGTDGYPQFIVSDNGHQVSAVEVASELFRKIKTAAEVCNEAPIDECYLTVPVYYNDHQREAIKTAARNAGMNVKELIIEPIAAVMSWCLNNERTLTVGEEVLVFDFGSEMLDISLLNFSVIDADDLNVGGNDVNIEIAKEVCKMVKDNEGISFDPLKTKKRERFLAACEEAKKQLASTKSTDIDLSDFSPDLDEIIFTDSELKHIVNHLFLNGINECIHRMTCKSDQTCEMITKVFMIGELSHLRAVREVLKNQFSHAIFPDINPETSVAEGALAMVRIKTKDISGIVDESISEKMNGVEWRMKWKEYLKESVLNDNKNCM
ncbi:chaperone HSP70, partial [Blastocystis sp. subtype 4]|uniref:chaperone HSP70 n=1 Tax=Blastocystis sp. subtype 4 TaxID=944170 RepID=UPI0007120765